MHMRGQAIIRDFRWTTCMSPAQTRCRPRCQTCTYKLCLYHALWRRLGQEDLFVQL